MPTLSTLTASAVAAVMTLAIPVASAAPLMLRPQLTVSSSSSSAESSESVSGTVNTDVVSSSSESSSSKRPVLQLIKPKPETSSSATSSNPLSTKLKPKPKAIAEYCKAVKIALEKGSSITPDAGIIDKFSLSIDMLTKAAALCDAMMAMPDPVSSSSSSSNWWTPSSSSSSYKGNKKPNFNACKNLGKEKTVGSVAFCKFICGLTVKVEPCPKP